MDAALPSSSSSYHQETPQKQTTTRSGLTLILPSLKNLKAAKLAKKSEYPASVPDLPAFDVEVSEKKLPRPVKLKPLKVVLTKLIQQIKKKDDYAFFLEPVNPSQVPGYSEAIKHPMDLGTMTNKVSRGKYRSLEDFANDLKLVTNNARIFNPPGSIYCTEADRIEAWALDHIAKASSTVIQYETDWNIDIEKDDDTAVNVDDDDEENPPTSIPVDGIIVNGRSPSVASQVQQTTGRRGPRGPYKKGVASTTVSESIDNEGRLPGSRDGIGAFPPCSHWSRTMVALKLKGKRYKTKKERLRFEKEGPPYLPDGSLDYAEMEDPFTVLSALVPDPLIRPHLTPVYPPLSESCTSTQPLLSQTQVTSESSTPQPEFPVAAQTLLEDRRSTSFPSTICLPLNYDPSPSITLEPPLTTTYSKRRHWHIVRNPIGRKTRDNVEDIESDEPPWHAGREAHPADFGSFSVLAAVLSEEMKKRGVTPGVLKDGEEEKTVFALLRDSLGPEVTAKITLAPTEDEMMSTSQEGSSYNNSDYFTSQVAAEAEEYIRDIVYGGVDGFAYVRSLAEFVSADSMESPSYHHQSSLRSGIGVSVNEYVQRDIDELTEGRHSFLRETAERLRVMSYCPSGRSEADTSITSQIITSLHLAPKALIALQALLQIKAQKIDMSALIRKPEELFVSEEEWAGKGLREKRKAMLERGDAAAKRFKSSDEETDTMEIEAEILTTDQATGAPNHVNSNPSANLTALEMEGPEELAEVLNYVVDLILELNRRIAKVGDTISAGEHAAKVSSQIVSSATSEEAIGADGAATPSTSTIDEDSTLRNLRLNLLALAKRAPLDTIDRLPLELVPEHIRHYIPTLDTSVAPTPPSTTGNTTPVYSPLTVITPTTASPSSSSS